MEEFSMPQSILQVVSEKGFDGMREIMQIIFNEAMEMERENYLHARPYQRTAERMDYANGFKPRTINSLQGEIQLAIPQTRNGGFYPSCLEKGMRSERSINTALAEMYIHGVATREVTAILEKMCGLEVSAMQVSRATQELDAEFKKWREQPLKSAIKYLLLDARYEKVRREDNTVADSALLIAYGITEEGQRRVLGVSVELSEAEVHWRKFLESLVVRGLHGLKMIVSDNHAGLKAARMSVFPAVPWQRCQFHLQQNATAYIPKKSMQQEVHNDIRDVFNMPTRADAEIHLKKLIAKYEKTASNLSRWLEEELPDGFTIFNVEPDSLNARRKLRTTNMVEFQNKELKKRTRCIRVFPNKESLLRIATALLIELDEKWLADGKAYLRS